MKAVFIEEHGGPEVVRFGELPDPEPAPGQVRVRTVAAALNHLDLFVRAGIPGVEPAMPHVMGSDGAGIVDAIGDEVDGWSVGDEVVIQPGLFCGRCEFCLEGQESLCIRYRLLGEHVSGTFAELVVVPEENLYRKPKTLGWDLAAAFPLVYQTAWRLVLHAGGLRAGQSVLIHGIGGGVSSAALQIAKYAGAFIYVTSSSQAKLDRAIDLGADVAIDYTAVEVADKISELTDKRGVDLVIDNVGADTWRTSIESVRRGGRIATCGATTGTEGRTPINRLFWKQFSIHGSTMANRREFRAVADLIFGERIVPIVDSAFPLDRSDEALARMANGEQFGKIVIDIGGD